MPTRTNWHFASKASLVLTIVDNKDKVSRFTVEGGEMFFAPSGSLHCFENVGKSDAVLIIAFSHEQPSDFSLHATFGAMSDSVLGNTYGLKADAFAAVKRDTSSPYVVKGSGTPSPAGLGFAEPYKFEMMAQNPPIDHSYGVARVARSQFWPILQNIAMYRIDVKDSGMREVHWHPETAEMGYVHRGRARMTILDPDGTTDTYILGPGDCYFIPRAYPHQIEVLGEDITFLIFFDQATPGDIGLKLCGSAISRDVYAATFGIDEAEVPRFPFTPADPLLVAKVNATDPVG